MTTLIDSIVFNKETYLKMQKEYHEQLKKTALLLQEKYLGKK